MASNYETIIDLTKQLSGQGQWSTQIYINIVGDPLRGIFLDRVVWWSDKSTREDGYFWKSAREWNEETGLSYSQVTRLGKELEVLGFISTKKAMANGSPTLHYKVNLPFVIEKIQEKYPPILNNVEIEQNEKSKFNKVENRNSTNLNIEIQQCSDSITAKTPAITTAKTTKEMTPGPLCQSLLDVCRLKWNFVDRNRTLSKSLLDTLKFLTEEGAQTGDISEFETWRKANHWTGKDGSAPTFKQIGELWGQYQDWVKQGRPAPVNKNGGTTNGSDRRHLGPLQRAGTEIQGEPTYDIYTNEYVYPDGRRVSAVS